MRISRRMYLSVVPALLGVFVVAALAYWGQYARAAPLWLVVVAAVATLGSLFLSWLNARYVIRRVERLATASVTNRQTAAAPDDLEAIEKAVDHLSTAVGRAEAAREAEQSSHRDLQLEYADLLSLSAREALQRLDEIRLPLHILLENHFGDLNENQEEMLGTARAAAEQAGDAFQRLGEIADLDRGATTLRQDRIRPGDLVAGVVPALTAEGQQRNVRVTAEVAPALQSVLGDRARLQLALELLLHDALGRTAEGDELRISAENDGREIAIVVHHGEGEPNPVSTALGRRLIQAQGGRVVERADGRDPKRRVTEVRLAR